MSMTDLWDYPIAMPTTADENVTETGRVKYCGLDVGVVCVNEEYEKADGSSYASDYELTCEVCDGRGTNLNSPEETIEWITRHRQVCEHKSTPAFSELVK